MKWHRIAALLYRDWRIFTRLRYKLVEVFYFPLVTVLLWGLFSVYAREYWLEAGMIILVINLFWSFAHLMQSEVNTMMMEDCWSGSLKQLLVSGISGLEYLFARMCSSGMAAVSVTVLLVLLASAFMDFPSYRLLVALIIPAFISSMALAGYVGSLIIILGRSYGFLAWSSMTLVVFLSAPFFPPSFFPPGLEQLSYFMPFTAVFAGVRQMMTESTVSSGILLRAYLTAAAYLLFSWPVFAYAFKRARSSGRLARLF